MLLSRREFITWSVGGAFLLATAGARSAPSRALSPWIRIDPNGRIHLYTTVSDMGQGSRTGQVQILADELDADWNDIVVEMAPDAEPFRLGGELYSGGSQAIAARYELLRKAAATVRAQLVITAATRWRVRADSCTASLSYVEHAPSGRKLRYGELAAAAASRSVLADPPLKPASARRYVGQSIAPIAVQDKVAGRATYGIDVRVPGMLYATLRQCPTFGGSLAACDPAPALASAGVRKVVQLPSAVAVVADNTWTAMRAAHALVPQWTVPAKRSDSRELYRHLREAYDASNAEVSPREGGKAKRDALRARFAASAKPIEATYEFPFLSHSPIEPMNATARVTRERVELWVPTQAQTTVRKDVAKALGRPVEEVVLHTTFLGGGFGRRLKSDYAVFAALVAREFDVPVQLTWSREEDTTHGFYRPAALMTCRATLDGDAVIRDYEMIGATADDTVFGGTTPAPYAIGEFAVTQTRLETGVPVGSWRSVDASISIFAKECFIDECAAAAGIDPLEYRHRLLAQNSRALRVLDSAAKGIVWNAPRQPNTGKGLALFQGWDTLVAHAIEVHVDGGHLRILRVVVAADPGTVVNPSQARAQLEGGTLMALGAALAEQITIRDGQVEQRNFDTYRLLRLNQAPPVHVNLLETADAKIGGIGEPPVPGVAPALANAIFQACGKRVRKLPFSDSGLAVA